jgi:hypothetical protein
VARKAEEGGREVKIEIPDAKARMLALLLHRLTWEDVMRRAESKQQCEDMLIAAEWARQEIGRAGGRDKTAP